MSPTYSLILATFIGLLSGAHAAIWGMYKDSIHEGFALRRFMRSIIIGSGCGLLLQMQFHFPLDDGGSLVLLFGLSYGLERIIVELWKTFFRNEDQSKYFIPMQFSIGGEPVSKRWIRTTLGMACVVFVLNCLVLLHGIGGHPNTSVKTTIAVGFATGLVAAIGGGWKDAPKEGFNLLKFFRSPAMTVAYALLFARFTDSYALLAIVVTGFERATAETYKTFFFPSKPRGKFTGKPVTNAEMFVKRRYFVPFIAGICVLVVILATVAVLEPELAIVSAVQP
jgi:hypothetical protein